MNKLYPYYKVPDISDLKQLVDFCEETYPDNIIFRYIRKNKEITKTYKEFNQEVEALATYFISKGYNRTHIAMLGETCYELILTYFAVINSGNVIVPLDKEAAIDDLRYLYEFSDATVLVHTNAYCEEAQQVGCETLINTKDIDDLVEKGKALVAAGDDSYKKLAIDKDALAVIVYTSGSTGKPKGVMISHNCLSVGISTTLKTLSVPDSHFLMLPLSHILAFGAGVVLPMFGGAEIFINSGIKNLIKEIQISKPKCILCVPMILETFYKNIQDNLKVSGKEKAINSLVKISNVLLKVGIDVRRKLFKKVIDALGGNLEAVLVGGAKVSENIIVGFHSFGIEIFPGYGLTEVTGVAMTRNKHFAPDSAGTVTPDTEIRIVDGEIQLKGDAVFLGYYKNEEATKESFDGEWFKTGDIGRIEDNLLYIDGRIKNLIVLSNGENVSPEELELKLLSNISGIKEILVYDKDGVLVAEIFSGNSDAASREQTERSIFEYNKNLPVYKQIGKVVFRDTEFQKTTSKKIKRM